MFVCYNVFKDPPMSKQRPFIGLWRLSLAYRKGPVAHSLVKSLVISLEQPPRLGLLLQGVSLVDCAYCISLVFVFQHVSSALLCEFQMIIIVPVTLNSQKLFCDLFLLLIYSLSILSDWLCDDPLLFSTASDGHLEFTESHLHK